MELKVRSTKENNFSYNFVSDQSTLSTRQRYKSFFHKNSLIQDYCKKLSTDTFFHHFSAFRLCLSDPKSQFIPTSTVMVSFPCQFKLDGVIILTLIYVDRYFSGHICLSILTDDWSPALSIFSVCVSIISMLSSCKEKVHRLVSFLVESVEFAIYNPFVLITFCRRDRRITICTSRRVARTQKRPNGGTTVSVCHDICDRHLTKCHRCILDEEV